MVNSLCIVDQKIQNRSCQQSSVTSGGGVVSFAFIGMAVLRALGSPMYTIGMAVPRTLGDDVGSGWASRSVSSALA